MKRKARSSELIAPRGSKRYICRPASNTHPPKARASAKPSGATLRCAPPRLGAAAPQPREWSTLRRRSWSRVPCRLTGWRRPGPAVIDNHAGSSRRDHCRPRGGACRRTGRPQRGCRGGPLRPSDLAPQQDRPGEVNRNSGRLSILVRPLRASPVRPWRNGANAHPRTRMISMSLLATSMRIYAADGRPNANDHQCGLVRSGDAKRLSQRARAG